MFEMNKKGWKRPKKSILTSFWVRTAPEIWSKYTTGACVYVLRFIDLPLTLATPDLDYFKVQAFTDPLGLSQINQELNGIKNDQRKGFVLKML